MPRRRTIHQKAVSGTRIHCSNGERPTSIQGMIGIDAEYDQLPLFR
jgi:hypothetical protein